MFWHHAQTSKATWEQPGWGKDCDSSKPLFSAATLKLGKNTPSEGEARTHSPNPHLGFILFCLEQLFSPSLKKKKKEF